MHHTYSVFPSFFRLLFLGRMALLLIKFIKKFTNDTIKRYPSWKYPGTPEFNAEIITNNQTESGKRLPEYKLNIKRNLIGLSWQVNHLRDVSMPFEAPLTEWSSNQTSRAMHEHESPSRAFTPLWREAERALGTRGRINLRRLAKQIRYDVPVGWVKLKLYNSSWYLFPS